jgi:hypothetical protein
MPGQHHGSTARLNDAFRVRHIERIGNLHCDVENFGAAKGWGAEPHP